jgi:hypothetical protein
VVVSTSSPELEPVVDHREAGRGVAGERNLLRLYPQVCGGVLAHFASQILRLEQPLFHSQEGILVDREPQAVDRRANRFGMRGDEEPREVEIMR